MVAADSFVQSQADLQETPQKITANVGQPSVLLVLLNKGFQAATPEDQQRIDMLITAHPDLELDYAVIKNDDGSLEPETAKDLYCFQKGVTLKTEINVFRIKLVKEFSPQKTTVDDTVEETSASTRALLS